MEEEVVRIKFEFICDSIFKKLALNGKIEEKKLAKSTDTSICKLVDY